MSELGAVRDSGHSEEFELRRKIAADRVSHLPIVEHALDLYAHGGPDMRDEAKALEALILDFSERMRRPR